MPAGRAVVYCVLDANVCAAARAQIVALALVRIDDASRAVPRQRERVHFFGSGARFRDFVTF